MHNYTAATKRIACDQCDRTQGELTGSGLLCAHPTQMLAERDRRLSHITPGLMQCCV